MKRVAILFGAGASIPWNSPLTSKITNAIRESNDHLIDKETFGNWINKILTADKTFSHNEINFETYVDLVETIHTCLISDDRKHRNLVNNTYKFFELKKEIVEGINKLEWNNGSYFGTDNNLKISSTFHSLIRIIGNQIIPYLNNFEKDEYRNITIKLKQFCEYFLNAGYTIRAYTLNYDRSIPLTMEAGSSKFDFFDGFDLRNEGKKEDELYLLNKARILDDTECNCYYNLHGSFHWAYQKKPNNNASLLMSTKKFKFFHDSINNDQMVATNPNEMLLQSKIITGYKKSQRIGLEPFNYFMHNFFYDIQKSEMIVVVGYSFSDPHINQLLVQALLYNKRVCIIDYKKTEIDNNRLRFVGYQLSIPNVFVRSSEDVYWAENLALNSKIYMNGFEEFLLNSEWKKLLL